MTQRLHDRASKDTDVDAERVCPTKYHMSLRLNFTMTAGDTRVLIRIRPLRTFGDEPQHNAAAVPIHIVTFKRGTSVVRTVVSKPLTSTEDAKDIGALGTDLI